MNIEIIAAIAFIIFLIVFLIIKRKNVVLQKIFHPILYMILYKSDFGIKFINKTAEKYKKLIIFIGYCFIGFGFFGMLFAVINIIGLLFILVQSPAAQTVSLVLPFTHIPGIGYLTFLHWIIAIFILAVVHEFSHGIVAKAHGIEINSSGFAFLCLFVPVIPAAFVEPDEKKMKKHSDVAQYSIFAAGPMANIILALIILLAMPYTANPALLAPFEDKITEPVGFSFDVLNESLPAAQAGLKTGMTVISVNGKPVKDANEFAEQLYYCTKPGETVVLGTAEKSYSVVTGNSDGRAIIGVSNVKNERKVLEKYEIIKQPYYWLKELFRWLFMLNLFIGIFNLLPLGITDGGLMMNTLLHNTMKDKMKARKIIAFISSLLLLILLIGLFTTYFGNIFAWFR